MQTQDVSSPEATVPSGLSTWADYIKHALIVPQQSVQGRHIDPKEISAPDISQWPEHQRAAYLSAQMETFRECLRLPGMDVREAILDDLATYYRLSADECLQRCLHWEEWSVREWQAGDRSTSTGLQAFYDSIQSWSFDLLWYAYLQACGFGYPASVVATQFALQHCPGGSHLDFGSGVGVTSQLFARLGFTTTLADVSKPLLDFACWRHQRHGDRATPINLTSGELPSNAFDIVTAVDTLVHVPDFDATVRNLHRVIRPGGWLLTNFDVRQKGPQENAWHLYHNAVVLEYRLEKVGFKRMLTLGNGTCCYQRVDTTNIAFRARVLWSTMLLPTRLLATTGRRIRWPTPRRIARLISRTVRK